MVMVRFADVLEGHSGRRRFRPCLDEITRSQLVLSGLWRKGVLRRLSCRRRLCPYCWTDCLSSPWRGSCEGESAEGEQEARSLLIYAHADRQDTGTMYTLHAAGAVVDWRPRLMR
jgi:hypothetical protein